MNTILYNSKRNNSFSDILPKLSERKVIPKIIHQTFFSKNLPAELQKNIENIRNLNPDWSHILYDDDDIESFIQENYGKVIFNYYKRINPKYGAARADFFRYLLMYKCGGVYLDIKSTCTCSLDQVLKNEDRFILSQWRNKTGEIHATWGTAAEVAHIEGGEYQQWHVVSAPGHPFLRAVLETVLNNIDNYRPWRNGTGGMGVLRLTGPLAYTLSIYPILNSNKYKKIENETAICLQYSIYKPLEHRAVYKKNYSLLSESIVQIDNFSKVFFYFYNLVRKLKRSIFNR